MSATRPGLIGGRHAARFDGGARKEPGVSTLTSATLFLSPAHLRPASSRCCARRGIYLPPTHLPVVPVAGSQGQILEPWRTWASIARKREPIIAVTAYN